LNVTLWVLAGVLAAVFAAAGLLKLMQDKKALASRGMKWVDDFSPGAVKAIGAAELLGAVGLIVPAAVHIAPVLVPIAAACLAVVMAGAVVTHLRLREGVMALVPAVLLIVAGFVAWARFGPYAF
jgi:hypothetical protein